MIPAGQEGGTWALTPAQARRVAARMLRIATNLERGVDPAFAADVDAEHQLRRPTSATDDHLEREED